MQVRKGLSSKASSSVKRCTNNFLVVGQKNTQAQSAKADKELHIYIIEGNRESIRHRKKWENKNAKKVYRAQRRANMIRAIEMWQWEYILVCVSVRWWRRSSEEWYVKDRTGD